MTTDVDLSQLAIERHAPTDSPRRQRRHLLTRYVLPGVLVAGFAALLAWAGRDVVFPPQRVTVVPVKATQSAMQAAGTPLFKAAGWVEPRPTPVRVPALSAGVVEQLLVVEDQAVKRGEPVAELVKADAKLAHERALADFELQEAQLDEAKAALTAATIRYEQPVHLDALVAEANAGLAKLATELGNLPFETRRAEAELTYAKTNYEGKLAAGDAVTGRVLAEAKSQLDGATAAFAELKNRAGTLAIEQAAMTKRRDALARQRELLADETQAKDAAVAKVKAATASVEQARVALAEAKLRLDRMTVRAPIDGRVFELLGFPGTTMSDGTTRVEGHDASTVLTLYRPDHLQVRVDVRFEDIPKVALGQPVTIASPAVSEPLQGRVLFVSSLADIQKNTLQVKVEILAPPPVFKPQMLVDVTFLAPEQPQASTKPTMATRLSVPQRLVHQGEGGSFVWVADQAAGVARRVSVKTGSASPDGMIEITSGLNVASRVIASGHESLRDGQRIRVTGEAGSDADASHEPGQRKALDRLPQHEGGQ